MLDPPAQPGETADHSDRHQWVHTGFGLEVRFRQSNGREPLGQEEQASPPCLCGGPRSIEGQDGLAAGRGDPLEAKHSFSEGHQFEVRRLLFLPWGYAVTDEEGFDLR